MALKKPSDFFGNNKKTPLDEVKESYESARPEKIEQVSEAFDAFKSNLNHIQSLSDFTSTFDSFKNNLEKVESVSSEVSEIKEEIKSLIKKEDLDSAMMAQLLFVEESISKIESKVSSINGKTVDKIREDFVNLSNSVESFLDLDVPKYKKLISESEVRFDDRLGVFKGQVEENLESIKETVESVNENTINIVKAEFKETAGDLNKSDLKYNSDVNSTDDVYAGSARFFWAASNYGLFNTNAYNIPAYNQYWKRINFGRDEQDSWSVTAGDINQSINGLLSIFPVQVLDIFRDEFINFSEATNSSSKIV